ncbi:MAG TPA: DUF3618 domain-containing protein [Burkholderiales bacterium]|nr:DUF3618 domain-containing protein [Burkholderiales bacterium]
MKANGETTLRPQEIEREIERTRLEMSGTLQEIQRRLSPGQLLDEGLAYLREGGPAQFASNLGGSVKREPLPVALIGIGVAWLMFNGRRGKRYQSTDWDYVSAEPSAVEKAEARARDTAHRIGDAAQATGERVSQLARGTRDQAQQIGERVSQIAHDTRDQAQHYTRAAQRQYQRARYKAKSMVEEQPLLLGVLGIALGATLGALLPSTRKEDKLMGETRDDLLTTAKDNLNAAKEKFEETRRSDLTSGSQGRQDTQPQSNIQPSAGERETQTDLLEPMEHLRQSTSLKRDEGAQRDLYTGTAQPSSATRNERDPLEPMEHVRQSASLKRDEGAQGNLYTGTAQPTSSVSRNERDPLEPMEHSSLSAPSPEKTRPDLQPR